MLRHLRLGTTHIVLYPDFADTTACADVRRAMDAGRGSQAEIFDAGFRVDVAVRRTFDIEVDRATVARVEELFAVVRDDMARAFDRTLRGAEGPGFLRYVTGGFYRRHRDALDAGDGEFPRLLSLVLFLTGTGLSESGLPRPDACTGGALRLYGAADDACDSLDVTPAAGMLAVFPAHVVHEVLPVTAGVRDVVVDWLY
jgi:predicted 2-oxoglutarate/Fe(II)-dependent dioxygenase YbiX